MPGPKFCLKLGFHNVLLSSLTTARAILLNNEETGLSISPLQRPSRAAILRVTELLRAQGLSTSHHLYRLSFISSPGTPTPSTLSPSSPTRPSTISRTRIPFLLFSTPPTPFTSSQSPLSLPESHRPNTQEPSQQGLPEPPVPTCLLGFTLFPMAVISRWKDGREEGRKD